MAQGQARPRWLRAAPFLFVGLWSGGFTAVRLSLDYVEPLTLQVLRYAVIVAVLAALAWALGLRLLPNALYYGAFPLAAALLAPEEAWT